MSVTEPQIIDEPGEGTVLVIDGEAVLAGTLFRIVERLGWRAEQVVGGSGGKKRLMNRDYDAVLCDVHMPDVDGPTFIEWLQQSRPNMVRRFAFVTGDTFAGANEPAQLGRPALEKPLNVEAVASLPESLR